MIDKLNAYLCEAPLHRDNLDFLSAVKTEVENLIKNVDKFTIGLTHDRSFVASKNLKSANKRKPSKGTKKLKTEGNDSSLAQFQADTFNSKYKRHVQHTEKFLADSNSRVQSISKSRRQTEKKEFLDASKKTKTKGGSRLEFIDRSSLGNKSWDSVKAEECPNCQKQISDLKGEIRLLQQEQSSQAILVENMQLELNRLKKQNAVLIQHLGINSKVFDD